MVRFFYRYIMLNKRLSLERGAD